MANPTLDSWLTKLGGYSEVRLNGDALPPRSVLDFLGAQVDIADNATSGTTEVTISALGAGDYFVNAASPNRGEVQIVRVGFTTHATASFGIDTTKIGTYASLDRWITLDGSAVSLDDRRLTLGTGASENVLELGGVGGKGARFLSPYRSRPKAYSTGIATDFNISLAESNVIEITIGADVTLHFIDGLPGQTVLVRIYRIGLGNVATFDGLVWRGEVEGQQSIGVGVVDSFVISVDAAGDLVASNWHRGDDSDTRIYGTTSVTVAPGGTDVWAFGATSLTLGDGTDALLQLVNNGGASVEITSTTHTGDLVVQSLGGGLSLSSSASLVATASDDASLIATAGTASITASTGAEISASDGPVTLASSYSSGTPTVIVQGEAGAEVVTITAPAAGAGALTWGAGATSVTITQGDFTATHATVFQFGATVAIRSGSATGASHGVAGVVTLHGGDATGQYGKGGDAVLEGGAGTDTSSAPTGGSGGDIILRPGLGLHHNGDVKIENAKLVTSASAGGATALPATPAGYLEIAINGTIRNVPFY